MFTGTWMVEYGGKEWKEYLYSAFTAFTAQVVLSKCSGMDHAVLPANYAMPAFSS